jgi:hypothetical protein
MKSEHITADMQPISTLTAAHGFVLLIADSGMMSTPLRCSVGKRLETGRIVTEQGDSMEDYGTKAEYWMPLPWKA